METWAWNGCPLLCEFQTLWSGAWLALVTHADNTSIVAILDQPDETIWMLEYMTFSMHDCMSIFFTLKSSWTCSPGVGSPFSFLSSIINLLTTPLAADVAFIVFVYLVWSEFLSVGTAQCFLIMPAACIAADTVPSQLHKMQFGFDTSFSMWYYGIRLTTEICLRWKRK